MDDFKKIVENVMKDEGYKKQIEEAIVKQVIDSINYKLSNEIYKIVKNKFDTEFKTSIEKQLNDSEKLVSDAIADAIKVGIANISNKIVFKPYQYELIKVIKEGIKINDDK